MALAAAGGATCTKKFRELVHFERTEDSPSTETSSAITLTASTSHSRSDLSRRLVHGARKASRSATVIATWLSRSSRRSRRPSCISFATSSKRHKSRNLCVTGGVGLNCVANARILRRHRLSVGLGPALRVRLRRSARQRLWHHHQTLENPRGFELTHAFHGTDYSEAEIVQTTSAGRAGV